MPNNITYFDGIIAQLQANTIEGVLDLTNRGLDNNDLVKLVAAFNAKTAVTELYLGLNTFNDTGLATLATLLTSNTSLIRLDVYDNPITDAGVITLVTPLQYSNTTLLILNLNDNPLTDNCAPAIAAMLENNTKLIALYMSGTKFTDAGVKIFSFALLKNSILTSFGIGGYNLITVAGAAMIANVIIKNTTLRTIAVINSMITNIGAQALATAIENSLLSNLNIAGNAIDNIGAGAFFAALQDNYSLQLFGLAGNPISAANLALLNGILDRNTAVQTAIAGLKANTLITLDLVNMGINDAGIALIAEAIKGNTSLRNINLFGNQIGDLGTIALIQAIQENITLVSIILGDNPIGDPGAIAIADFLTTNTVLRNLNLQQTFIGNPGGIALANSLKRNNALITFGLAITNITDPGARAFADAFTINTAVGAFGFSGNQINSTTIQAFLDAFANNYVLTYFVPNSGGIEAKLIRNRGYLQLGPVFSDTATTALRNGYNSLIITQGEKFPITPQNIKASSVDSNATVSYTVTTKYGCVVNANNEPITQVSDVDTANNNVFGIPDGSSKPMELVVIATDGTNTTVPHPTAVVFIPQDSAPMLVNNNFTLIDGETTIITPAMLSASFPNVTTPQSGLAFNVKTTGGYLSYIYDNSSTPLTYLTQGSVIEECVGFRGDGSGDKPTIDIQVTDGRANNTNPFIPAVVSYIPLTTTTTTATTTKPNQPPVVVHPIANQTAIVGQAFVLPISVDAFDDADGDFLHLKLTLDNGEPLPDNLIFNGTALSGTPDTAETDTLLVTAIDPKGASASLTFQLQVITAMSSLFSSATISSSPSSSAISSSSPLVSSPPLSSSSSASATTPGLSPKTTAIAAQGSSQSNASVIGGAVGGAFAAGALISTVAVGLYRRYWGTDRKIAIAVEPLATLPMTNNPVHPSFSGSKWSEQHYDLEKDEEEPAYEIATNYGAPSSSIGSRTTIFSRQEPELVCYAETSTDDVKPGFQQTRA